MTTDEVRILMARLDAHEEESEDRDSEIKAEVAALRQEVDRAREDLREATALLRQMLEDQRIERAQREHRVDRCINVAEKVLTEIAGDPWVRRTVVAAVLALGLGLAGFQALTYEDGKLTIGSSDVAPSKQIKGGGGGSTAPMPAP